MKGTHAALIAAIVRARDCLARSLDQAGLEIQRVEVAYVVSQLERAAEQVYHARMLALKLDWDRKATNAEACLPAPIPGHAPENT